MANPIETVINAVKRGDRKTLLIGAGAIGGGVGLIVYLRNRSAGGGVQAMPNDQSALGDQSGGGGGGGGGSLGDLGLGGTGDLSGLGLTGAAGDQLALPTLGDVSIPSSLADSTVPSNFADTNPIGIGDLPSLLNTAAPIMGGGGFALPEIPQPISYTGADYGQFSTLPDLPTIGGAGGINPTIAAQVSQPTIQTTQPAITSNPLATVKGRLDTAAAFNALASKVGAPITDPAQLASVQKQLAPIVQNMQIAQAKAEAAKLPPPITSPAQLAPIQKQLAPIVEALKPKAQSPIPVSNLAVYQGVQQNLSKLGVYVSPQQFASIGAPITNPAQLQTYQAQFNQIVQAQQIAQAKAAAQKLGGPVTDAAQLSALRNQLAQFVPAQYVGQNSRLSQRSKYGG